MFGHIIVNTASENSEHKDVSRSQLSFHRTSSEMLEAALQQSGTVQNQ